MGKSRADILIVDDEPIKRTVLADQLKTAGYSVASAESPLAAEALLSEAFFDVVLTDLRMPGLDGLSFLRNLRQERPDQVVIVMTAYGTVETAIEAMKLGASDYLQKPFSTEELLLKLDKLRRYDRLANENETLRKQLSLSNSKSRIVGRSKAIRDVLARIHAVAGTDAAVLIEGESGTGKELVARAIHATSYRATGRFVAVACAALPGGIIESELFGHEPGAFTGATKRHIGRFELAHGGTLFLDDVDDISAEVQVKLLRVLQERTLDRVGGGEHPIRVNVRVIAATKRSLSEMVSEGEFREDLFYRLSVVPLRVPPLRERLEDIPDLVDHLLQKFGVAMNRGRLTASPEVVAKLRSYTWPGNVRQLEHTLEHMVALSAKDSFEVADVPELSVPADSARRVTVSLETADSIDMPAVLDEVESRLLKWALGRSGGNLASAARMLHIPRSTLQYRANRISVPASDTPSPPERE